MTIQIVPISAVISVKTTVYLYIYLSIYLILFSCCRLLKVFSYLTCPPKPVRSPDTGESNKNKNQFRKNYSHTCCEFDFIVSGETRLLSLFCEVNPNRFGVICGIYYAETSNVEGGYCTKKSGVWGKRGAEPTVEPRDSVSVWVFQRVCMWKRSSPLCSCFGFPGR